MKHGRKCRANEKVANMGSHASFASISEGMSGDISMLSSRNLYDAKPRQRQRPLYPDNNLETQITFQNFVVAKTV